MAYDLSPEEAALEAGLVYSEDNQPGYSRKRAGKGFAYYDPEGSLITASEVRQRCNALAIPPAYTDVWICINPRGHLQATGRDARGRKTYRYHDLWRELRDRHKFRSLTEFGRRLSDARLANDANRARQALSAERVLAGIFFLLDSEALRIGSPAYLRQNGSYGATTLTEDQVQVKGHDIGIRFTAKGGKEVDLHLSDAKLEKLIRRMSQLPGQHLFRYERDGEVHAVTSTEVNDYLREIFGCHATAKQFRTWAGCVSALERAMNEPSPAVASVLGAAAQRLHNTPAVCRKSYVHPGIVEAVKDGTLPQILTQVKKRMPKAVARQPRLSDTEKLFLSALERDLFSEN